MPAATSYVTAVRPRRRPRPRIVTVLAVLWLGAMVLSAIFADVLPLPRPDVAAGPSALGPFEEGGALILGTDRLGRSELSRIIFGARSSLTIGVLATVVGAIVGGLLGVLSGYFRGGTDAVIGATSNMVLAIPPLVLMLSLSAIFTPNLLTLLGGLTGIVIPYFMRVARSATLSYATREFVMAARALGASHARIVFKELIPNVFLPVASYAFVLVAILITVEGTLSYLGVGIPPPTPSWGGMISTGQQDLRTNAYLLFIPAVALFLTVFALNILGDVARRIVNVREVAA